MAAKAPPETSAWTGADEGGVHWHRHGGRGVPTGDADVAPLVCLHPMPFDGAFFRDFARRVARHRCVWCPDYPGFGRSDPLPGNLSEAPSITRWADALARGYRELNAHEPADWLGFHTGCLVAGDLALRHPDLVRRLVLVDVPWFDADRRRTLEAKTTVAPRYRDDSAALAGFRAAFTYDPLARFPRVRHETLVVGTAGNLHDPSAAAAAALPTARFLDRRDIAAPVFGAGAPAVAACVSAFLDGD